MTLPVPTCTEPVVLVNFARRQWKAGVTAEFRDAYAITNQAQLEDVAWVIDTNLGNPPLAELP
jgi:hypothetical protein